MLGIRSVNFVGRRFATSQREIMAGIQVEHHQTRSVHAMRAKPTQRSDNAIAFMALGGDNVDRLARVEGKRGALW